MQGLKILVIALAVLIVAGITVILITAVNRMKGGTGGHGFGSASLILPKGCRVTEIAGVGAKLALRLGDGPDCQAIIFLDPESGRETGRVSLLGQP